MNKQEYLELLRFYTHQLEPEVQSDLLSEVEAHFVFGEEQGKTEEQIAEELGDPVEMAKETVGPGYKSPILSTPPQEHTAKEPSQQFYHYPMYPPVDFPQQNPKRSLSKKLMLVALSAATLLIVGAGFTGVLGVAGLIDDDYDYSNTETITVSTSGPPSERMPSVFNDEFGEVITSSILEDFELSDGQERLEGVIQLDGMTDWKELEISTEFGFVDVQFKQGDRNEIAWTAITTPKIGNYIQNTRPEGEELHIDLETYEHLLQAEDRYSFVVTLRDDYKLRKFEIDQDLGEFSLRGGKFDEVFLGLDTGVVRASDIDAQSMKVETDNGVIELERIQAPLIIDSTTGDVKLSDTMWPVQIDLDTGNVEVAMKETHDVNVTTNMGMSTITVPRGAEGIYELVSGMGEIEAPPSNSDGTFKVNVKTDMGAIYVNESK